MPIRTLFVVSLLVCFSPLSAGASDVSSALNQCRQLLNQGDAKITISYCQPLAEQGEGEASFIVSSAYSQSKEGDKPDLSKAIIWLTQSAEQGYPPACYNLAALYERGDVLEPDYATAFNWYKKGAELGHVPSQLKTGILSLKGVGTTSNYTQAKYWLDKAAQAGNQSAQVTLAILLGVSDSEKSLYWYLQAAKQKNAYAYYQLADIYFFGKLKQAKNLQKAESYAEASVKLGRKSSETLLSQIRAELAAEESSKTQQTTETVPSVVEIANSNKVTSEESISEAEQVTDQNRDQATTSTVDLQQAASAQEITPLAKPEAELDVKAEVKPEVQPEQASVTSSAGEATKTESSSGSMLKDQTWLMSQNSNRYVLQLIQLSRESAVLDFLKDNQLQEQAHYYRARTKAGTVYVVLYGESFNGLSKAKLQAQQLPAAVAKDVWYRSFGALQKSFKAP